MTPSERSKTRPSGERTRPEQTREDPRDGNRPDSEMRRDRPGNPRTNGSKNMQHGPGRGRP